VGCGWPERADEPEVAVAPFLAPVSPPAPPALEPPVLPLSEEEDDEPGVARGSLEEPLWEMERGCKPAPVAELLDGVEACAPRSGSARSGREAHGGGGAN
jgi:hypothetical protein